MSKKILFMSSAKLTAISIGLLLAVFCTVGMSFRPVYDEEEAAEIVMHGPRRSHWTTSGSCGGTDYHNKTDYAKTVAQSMNVAYGTVAITANTKNATPVTAANGSQSYVEWDSGIGASETSDQRSDLEAIHTNTITFTATPTDPEEYRFVGWYSDAGGTSLVSDEEETPWQKDVKFDSKYYTYNSGSHANTEYENASSKRWTVTYYAKFEPIPSTNVTFLAASTPAKDNGSYTVVGKGVNSTITTSNQVIPVKSITLTATPSEATEFLNWYKLGAGDEKIILSTENPFTTSFTEETTVGVEWRELEKNLTIVFKAVEKDESGVRKGSYTVDGVTVSATDHEHFTGDTYRYSPALVATPATGYSFKGWYVKEAGVKRYLSTDATWTPTITEELTIYADFVFTAYPAESLAQFKVGSTYYDDLNAANTAAHGGSNKVIICSRDGYLLPGNYTISSDVTLLIPYSSSSTSKQTTPALIEIPSPAPLPNAYRTLTMLDGADITCNGTICVGGQMISHQGGNPTGCPGGDLGVINMANGGHIELTSGATLYCWGLIKGQDRDKGNNTDGVGTITANNGATVWENIAFGDWRGGSQTFAAYECRSTYRSFPFQSYSIQNIEVPLSLKYGASEKVYTALYIPTGDTGSVPTSPTLIANSGALFLLKDPKSLVRKWYDPTTDLVCYEMSGTAQLNELSITVTISIASRTINSADFDLPICSNMHIILTKCDMTLSKPMTMHAGSVLEIKPDAKVTIASDLHLFDYDQFDQFAYNKYFMTVNNLTSHKYRGTGAAKTDAVTGEPYIEDAKVIVDGTLTVDGGGLYTSSSGANIMGNGGGKVIFKSTLPSEKNIWFLKGGASGTSSGGTKYHFGGILGRGECDIYLTPYSMTAANLCNEDGTYTKSAKNTFYNVNGRWFVEGKQNERTSAGLEHTYEFTYMASGNSGENVTTSAVYSHDRTGLEPRMKWFNVNTDACANWWVDGSSRLYNWTLFSDWHQFIPTEITDVYGCSNGELYTKVSCTQWDPLGGTDENCLYTIGGVKKALVGTSFIEMEPNADDAAYHRKGAATEYYISFDGCIWHSATRIEGERKAYTVEEQQFIWFENNWLNVTREAPFFYSTDELNVKTYYEYIGSEWVIAEPYVRVTTDDPTQTRSLLTLYEALAVASQLKNATVTILRDIPTAVEPAIYAASGTTCTLDLNGHTVTSAANPMININAAGTTFTILDNTTEKKGQLRACPVGGNVRTIGVQVTKGTLKLQSGKIYSTNLTARTSSLTAVTNSAVVVKGGAIFTMTGGSVESEDEHQPYGVSVETNGTMNLSGGEVIARATSLYASRGINLGNGNLNMSGGSVQALAPNSTTVYGILVGATASYTQSSDKTSKSYATLTLTGGYVLGRSTKDARGVHVTGAADVTGDYNETTINQTVKVREYGVANISGGTIIAETTTDANAYGVYSYGTTTISGGTITATVLSSTKSGATGVRAAGGTTTIKSGANIIANAPTLAYGALVTGEVDGTRGWQHFGILNVQGGTITANTSNTTRAYGLYVTASTKNLALTNSYKVFNGDYASYGTATITGGTFNANAKTTSAEGIHVEGTKTLNAASATPVCTINGGYFKMTGTGSLTGANTAALPANFHVNGGYYSHDGNLEGYTTSPKHVVTLPSSDPNRPNYNYKVAEAYTITFKSENGETTLQSSYQEKGTTPEYNGEPQTKPSSTTTSYVFDGWSSAVGGSLVSPLTSVTSSGGTYYAHFNETTLKYMVTLDAKTNGGNEESQVLYINPGAAVGTLPTATKTGYTFSGWYTSASGGTKLETTATINADATYIAQFTINQHTLTWNLSGGKVTTAGTAAAANATGSPSGSVNYDAAINAPTVVKTGYTFAGWGVPSPASKMPDNDLSYTAHWNPATNTKYYVKHYQQNINDDGYTLADTETKTGTTDATVTPDRKSYDGFLTPDPQSLTIGAAGTSSLTYNYDRVVYTIKWNAYANGVTCATPSSTVRHGATLGSMPVATPNTPGVVFGGWYTAADGGTRITETTQILQNYGTLYAHFVPTYTVTWKNYDESTLTTIELPYDAIPSYGSNPTPEREADENYVYTFDGWSATNGGDKVEEPLPAIFENKTYYAHYSTTPTVASVKVGSNTTYYTDFATAWAFVQEQTANTTIKLLQDATVTTSMVFTPAAAMTCTFDLNNHTLSGAVNKLVDVNLAGSTFIITDNSEDKNGKISTELSTNARLYSVFLTAGTLKLQNGKIYSKNPHTYSSASSNKNSAATGVYVTAGQTFTMDGGAIESTSQYSSYALYIAQSTTSVVTINGGLIKGQTNASSTAAGIFNYSTKLTINGGHIIGHAWTKTAYGLYQYGGSATLNGGKIEATNDTTNNKGTTGTYGIQITYVNSTYKGALNIPATSTVEINARSNTSGARAINTTGTGTITVSGGTFNVHTKTATAYGILAARGTVTVNGTPTFNVTAGTTTAYGAYAYGTIGAKGTGKYSGTINIKGGTFNVTSTQETAYGALAGMCELNLVQKGAVAGDTIFGHHYMPGIISVTNGTFNVKAKTTAAYGIVVAAAKSESGAVGTTARRPTATITGGNFKVESKGDDNATAYAMNTSATATYLKVQGGKYSTKRTNASATSNIEDKYTAPTKSCNYHVLPLTGEDPYKYEVAEAYTITFNNYDGTQLQSTAVKKGATPAYSGETPTKAEDASYTYSFTGWSPAITAVSATATYTAQFSSTPKAVTYYYIDPATGEETSVTSASTPSNPADYDTEDYHYTFDEWVADGLNYRAQYSSSERTYGAKLDIVDWTADHIVVNATNLRATNGGTAWTIKYASANYTKTNLAADRTVLIARDKAHETTNGYVVIKLQGTAGVESRQKYTVPLIYDENATLSGTESNSVVYVHMGATLTVDANTTISKLYVSPAANVEITSGKLTVTDTLALRTLPWQSAAINGNFTAGHTYYTRIGPDKNKTIAGLNGTTTYVPTRYYQLALPLSCSIAAVRLSDGTTPAYESTWALKNYSESLRASQGSEENNWVFVPESGTIQAWTGYEFISNYKYYREYYFPVTPPASATTVTVARTGDDKANSGWNMICSPLMSRHQKNPHPEDITVSWLNEEDGYTQEIPDIIHPAIPFFYQAKADNEQLSFAGTDVKPSLAPRRVAAAEEQVRIQWMHLDIKDASGQGDQTSVYSHPTRYEQTYKTGIDVAKQSFSASRALIYSSHAYGEMAFAGVADVLLENGVALTVYSPKEQELTISMRDNEWLDRMAYVWLIDNETGAQIDLLDSDYTFEAAAGTTTGRFILMGRFFAPQIATDIDEVDGEQAKPKKLIIRDKLYILINDQLYDGTGKMVK